MPLEANTAGWTEIPYNNYFDLSETEMGWQWGWVWMVYGWSLNSAHKGNRPFLLLVLLLDGSRATWLSLLPF